MPFDYKVCPDCGNDTFTQRRYVTAEATVHIYGDSQIDDVAIEVMDHGDPDDDALNCRDCFLEWDIEDLITLNEYMDEQGER